MTSCNCPLDTVALSTCKFVNPAKFETVQFQAIGVYPLFVTL